MHRETRRRRVRPNSFSSDWILPRSSGRNSIRSATGTSSRHANGWSSSRRPKPRSLSLPGSSTKDAPWHFSPGCLSGGRCPDYRQPLPRLGDRIPRVQPPGGDLEPCRRRGIGRLRIRSARLPAPRVSRPPLADTDVDGLGFTVQPKKTFELELTRPEDEIWAGFKSTCRTAIRKAQKSGVIVEQAMAQRSRTSTTLSSTTSSRVNRCRPRTARARARCPCGADEPPLASPCAQRRRRIDRHGDIPGARTHGVLLGRRELASVPIGAAQRSLDVVRDPILARAWRRCLRLRRGRRLQTQVRSNRGRRAAVQEVPLRHRRRHARGREAHDQAETTLRRSRPLVINGCSGHSEGP